MNSEGRQQVMPRILVLYFSQSGEVSQAVQSFVKPLESAPVEIVWERIRPKVQYPYPWRGVGQFFDVFPECINQEPPEIHPPSFDPGERFDLVIFAYQVWFLAPSLPAQGFLQSEFAEVLRDTNVITLIVCRSMWYTASETMKQLMAERGGLQIDNVVVTHQGSGLATFITTPRMLLTGRKDRLLGVFPRAGTKETEIEGLGRFGRAIASNLAVLRRRPAGPLLRGLDAVEVNLPFALLERLGRRAFGAWARLARRFGPAGSWKRRPIIYLFVGYLIISLVVAVPLSLLFQWLVYPLISGKFDGYVRRLKSPSGVA